MHPQTKLTEHQKNEILSRRENYGETLASLGKAFGVSETTIRKVIARDKNEIPRFDKAKKYMPSKSIQEFAKRAKSITWRQDGLKKETYERWKEAVEEFKARGMTQHQAVVQASKDFACLKRLFREYDVSEFDPHPESHPDVGQPPPAGKVECEGREQSHRENLAWAIEAAGKYLRTQQEPTVAPNDAAYYLYCQAKEAPKDFLGKYNQVEVKGDDESEKTKLDRSASKRSIREIEEMLTVINEGNQ